MRKLTLHITGMTCGHCLQAVNDALASKPGVRLESLRIGRAVVSYDEQTTDPAAPLPEKPPRPTIQMYPSMPRFHDRWDWRTPGKIFDIAGFGDDKRW